MNDISRDPVFNVIQNQIKRSIRVLLDNKCWGAAVLLTYSGIDTMASLSMPENQIEVTQKDFITWAERYIRFPCKEQLTGAEIYGARCGMLHTYTPDSKRSRSGEIRVIGYMPESIPEIRYLPNKENLVLVSVTALVEVFFRGVDQSLIDLFSDSKKKIIIEARLKNLTHEFPYKT